MEWSVVLTCYVLQQGMGSERVLCGEISPSLVWPSSVGAGQGKLDQVRTRRCQQRALLTVGIHAKPALDAQTSWVAVFVVVVTPCRVCLRRQ
jgi:hypothetical protein